MNIIPRIPYCVKLFSSATFFSHIFFHYIFVFYRYLNYFPETRKKNAIYVDKSANYFDSLKSPLRAYSLLPKAKLIAILIDPRLRAYSWYQVNSFLILLRTVGAAYYDDIRNLLWIAH